MTIFRTGDAVRIRFDGREVDGRVRLASSNGRSLALEFEAILGGWVGMMPVAWHDGGFRDLRDQPVEIIGRSDE